MAPSELASFARGLPKAELHLHLEGTLEPDMMFALAQRNGLTLPYSDVAAVKAAYDFTDLTSFLAVYYPAMGVLQTADDFHDLAWAYLLRAKEQGVVHAELFFDPQAHTGRGIPFATVIGGYRRAVVRAQAELGISAELILCFLRSDRLTEDCWLVLMGGRVPETIAANFKGVSSCNVLDKNNLAEKALLAS